MGLRSPTVPFSQMNQQQSDQYARKVPVVPDAGSVGTEILKPKSVTEPKLDDLAVSTRAIADRAVSDAKLRNSNALSVIGRSANTNGAPADIAASVTNTFLARRGTQLVFDPLTDADIPSGIARDTEVTAAIAAHEAASDPHPTYTTAAELSAAITAHEGAANPHPTYLTQAEADALYQPLTLTLTNAVDDAAAATAGVAVGKLYRNGSVVMIRVT